MKYFYELTFEEKMEILTAYCRYENGIEEYRYSYEEEKHLWTLATVIQQDGVYRIPNSPRQNIDNTKYNRIKDLPEEDRLNVLTAFATRDPRLQYQGNLGLGYNPWVSPARSLSYTLNYRIKEVE